MKKVGILTWHYYNNFGSALQAYALQKTLQGNFDVEILNYRNPIYNGSKYVNLIKKVDFVYHAFCRLCSKMSAYKFQNFRKRFFKESPAFTNDIQLKKYATKYDCVVVGSDQIWAPNCYNPIYMLNFLDGLDVKKVSYAASIGLNSIPQNLREDYRRYLSNFSHISVRENNGKTLLEEQCQLKSQIVLDPTLLLSVDDYKKIEKKYRKITTPFIFCYFLNENNLYKEKVKKYAKDKGIDVFGVSANPKDADWLNITSGVGPQEFLWLIRNATAVFTDSYHGTIFSLLYHKEFYLFERFKAEDPICQNSRINQLCRYFSIDDRILTKDKFVEDCQSYDYTYFEERLKEERVKSVAFLSEALGQ